MEGYFPKRYIGEVIRRRSAHILGSGAGPVAAAAVVAVAWLIGGCSQARPTHLNPFPIHSAEYQRVFRASIEVLREHQFTVARSDYRFGRILTAPQTSATVLEPWHNVNTTSERALESTINEQHRRVAIEIAPEDDPERSSGAGTSFTLAVRAEEYRHRMPRRHLTGSTDGGRIFSDLATFPSELRAAGIAADYWQPVGRDGRLEQRILADIIRRSMTLPAADPVGPSADDATAGGY